MKICRNCETVINTSKEICPICKEYTFKKRDLTTKSKLKQKAWVSFSKFVRVRDCLTTTGKLNQGVCYTCGEVYPIDKLQAGHLIHGRTNNVLFDEENVKAQCRNCNIFNEGEQAKFLIKRIEEEVSKGLSYKEALGYFKRLLEDKTTKSFTEQELYKISKEYEMKVAKLGR